MEIAEAIQAEFSVGNFANNTDSRFTFATTEELAEVIEAKLWELMPDGAR